MTQSLFAWAMLLSAGPCGPRFDEPKRAQPPTREPASLAGQINALEKEFQKKEEQLSRRISASKDPAERSKLCQEYRELRPSREKQFLELVRKNPKDTAALKALKLVVERGDTGKNAREVDLQLPQRRLQAFFAARNAPCLDLLPAFYGQPDTYAPRDTHWNERGNELAASCIAKWLVEVCRTNFQ